MPTTARGARIHEYGPPEVLRFEDIVVGEPGDDEALIRNTVIGLNFVDVYGVRSRNGKNRTLRPSKDHSTKRKRSRTRLQLVLCDNWHGEHRLPCCAGFSLA